METVTVMAANPLDILKEKFLEIAPEVTPNDVNHAVIDIPTSSTTVWRYLRGEIKKEAFGNRLYMYLKNRIEARSIELNRVAS